MTTQQRSTEPPLIAIAQRSVPPVDLPFSDLSTVDGFAVRDADVVAGARVRLRVIGQASAGHPYFGAG